MSTLQMYFLNGEMATKLTPTKKEKNGLRTITEGSDTNSITYEIPMFIKWAGGKFQLIEQYRPLLPKIITRYFEPFIGGGAIFFYIQQKYKPKQAYLSDLNIVLANTYTHVRSNVNKLIPLLQEHKDNHSEDHYYEVRDSFNKETDSIKRAAYFIYLNKTCFNGLYRVNSKGGFNVPFGKYVNPSIFKEYTLRKASELLQKTDIKAQDFKSIEKATLENDFIYFDPPYQPLNQTSSFTTYTENGFGETEQQHLADLFKRLDEKGCKLMLSNSDTQIIRDLYANYDIKEVKARRSISCNGEGRGAITELVIRNY